MNFKNYLKSGLIFIVSGSAISHIYAQDSTKTNLSTMYNDRLDKWNRTDSFKQRFNIHLQMTYINQIKPKMHADYSGPYSLIAARENQNSLTSTLYIGLRLWKGANFYFNPELAGGSGLSGAQGMGGSSNGETFRVGNPSPTLYIGRAVLEQLIPLGNKWETQDDDENQIAEAIPQNYFKLTVGKYSLADVFDNNEFSNSPRTQFMNWSLMNNASWDFAANVRGYTYTASGEVDYQSFNFKLGAAMLPKVANGADINTNLSKEIALNAEVKYSYQLSNNRAGHIRLLYFNNKANMGIYQNAIDFAELHNVRPNIDSLKPQSTHKWGFGLNWDQDFGNGTGVFSRIGYNNGKTETWNFTEVDQTVTFGVLQNGQLWKRPNDNFGIALAFNGLSSQHKNYLKAGGYGFILGDGTLNYGIESIIECFYSFKPIHSPIWFSGDYQFCLNPGYNKDRGPANIFSARMHVEL